MNDSIIEGYSAQPRTAPAPVRRCFRDGSGTFTGDDFDAYAVGKVQAEVCTSLSAAEARERLGREHPPGIGADWHAWHDEPCEARPGFVHYRFSCF